MTATADTITGEPGPVMFPAPVCPPNNLRRGDVVIRDDGERGVVACDPGGYRPIETILAALAEPQDVRITMGPQSSTVTNNHHRRWERVPYQDQTIIEAVRSIRYQYAGPAGEPVDPDAASSLAEALLKHSDITVDVYGDDGDMTVFDLASDVAGYITELETKITELEAAAHQAGSA